MTQSDTNHKARRGAAHQLDQALLSGWPAFLGFLTKRLGNKADAEDVLQEFGLRVLAKKEQLRDVERINAWLYAILRSSLNDFYRKTGRQTRLNESYAAEQNITSDAAEIYAQLCACVRAMVTELKLGDAELIRRIDLDEEARKAVADDLGLASGTLAVRLHRARIALRDKLLGHCGYCCDHGFEDCACASSGCHNEMQDTHCAPELPAS